MSDEPQADVNQPSDDQPDFILPAGEKYAIISFTFWDNVGIKLVETLTSVKLWGLVSMTTLSSMFLVQGLIDGGQWVTVNGTIYGLIFGMREAFKISQIFQRAKTGAATKKIPV